jgi:hypothetical protein
LKQWDVFLSHSSEDKQAVAIPLAEALRRTGVRVWLDKFQIDLGDSIRQKVDQGLVNSRFGVVILSQSFFTKHWTGQELDALWTLDAVLPVLHEIDQQTVKKYSPLLAGKLSISTAEGIDVVAETIASRIFKPRDKSQKLYSQVAHDFSVLLANSGLPNELVSFVGEHPRILSRSLGVHLDAQDMLRSSVQLGPHLVDFCAATFQPSVGRLGDFVFVLFGPMSSPLFIDSGQMDGGLTATIQRAKNLSAWLQSNTSSARQVLHDVGASVLIKIVAGGRPQPGSPTVLALQGLNDDMIGIQVRTYDWLLDSALAIAEGGDDD